MYVTLDEVLKELKTLLRPEQFNDYCPNGLQVEGRSSVRRIVSGVTASQALIDRAIAAEADLILVHHGYFWRGEDAAVTGIKKSRIHSLLTHDISLLAYHLPLDAHAELGNNAQLGKLLGFSTTGDIGKQNNHSIGLTGEVAEPCSGVQLAMLLESKLGRAPLHIAASDREIGTVAWCTGGAQNYIELAVKAGVDAYITGEISEQTVHIARETGIHFFAAGHHATERYGVQAVAAHLATRFGLEHQFIDIDNPV
ncbi:MAG: Nif3-like dinuclear metal center hexameric protein [Gammaproteobacteria bacterium]|nr:Nif3-like dinuclear metal center hexameric protein [Gammaproteobacteria bacterium]MDP2140207.1 Nif3-like dinuclear metal center hexameric protein [Gammaproteobacteria bacterium]MDP2348083.1 Nif3-like dinuclear metal center hexameric protein [Gammaproteobacteria bacterium]